MSVQQLFGLFVDCLGQRKVAVVAKPSFPEYLHQHVEFSMRQDMQLSSQGLDYLLDLLFILPLRRNARYLRIVPGHGNRMHKSHIPPRLVLPMLRQQFLGEDKQRVFVLGESEDGSGEYGDHGGYNAGWLLIIDYKR